MKKLRDLSYRIKLALVFSLTILVALVAATTVLTVQSFRYSYDHIIGHMQLLTEQTLLNYETETDAIARQLATQIINRQIPSYMYELRGLDASNERYYRQTRALTDALNQMISAQSGYDTVYVRLTNGPAYSSTYADRHFSTVASDLLSQSYGEKTYGASLWIRTEDGEIYLLRDVYNQSPFQHVGKVVAHIRSTALSSLSGYNEQLQSAVVMVDENSRAIAIGGIVEEGMLEAAQQAFVQQADSVKLKRNYSVYCATGQKWTAVGLMPESVLSGMLRSVICTGVLVAMLCAALGSVLVMIVTRSMTRRMEMLVRSMDEVTAGNLDLMVPVESQDEIGRMSMHFNTMMDKTRELLVRVVQEEGQRNRAEYDMLEYKYRSLQSQINPHFIYNALEVVNAIGKLSGQQEICKVVRHISTFFRRNTRNMQNRFITVQEEFDSLRQYAYIYCYIYGDILSTPFSIEDGVNRALIPTMILQPVLENALVHGIRAEHAVVSLNACTADDGRLCLQIRDNGKGIPPEMIERILNNREEQPSAESSERSGVGMRNVRDRLKLIYREQLTFSIESQLDRGTLVSILVPLIYAEKELERHRESDV